MLIEPTKDGDETNENKTESNTEQNADLLSNESEKMTQTNATAGVPSSSTASSSAHATAAAEAEAETQLPSTAALARARGKQIAKYQPSEAEAQATTLGGYVLEQLHDSFDMPSTSKAAEEKGEMKAAAQRQHFSDDDENANPLGDVPSLSNSKSMEEIYMEISKAQKALNATQTEEKSEEKAERKLTARQPISKEMLDKVMAEHEQTQRHQAAAKVYDLLNAQAKIINALMENEEERAAQKEPIEAYFAKFKQFMAHLQDNQTNGQSDKLLAILREIEGPKETVKFAEELAAMDQIREEIGTLEQGFREKNAQLANRNATEREKDSSLKANFAEGVEKIGDGVKNVVEYQFENYVKKELVLLTKAKRNSLLPLKIITDFFGALELAMAYLNQVHDIIKDLVDLSSFRRYFIIVETRLVYLRLSLSIIREEAAKKLHFSGQLSNIAGPIQQIFTEKVLKHDQMASLHEIMQMATLEGKSISEEQVVLLCLSNFVLRVKLLLQSAQKHLKRIGEEFELINSVALVTKSADVLAKFRRTLLPLDELQNEN
ncbi:hypothetical protein niasHS_007680 [Heterodera schachtii]|uniref:Uncharacterized protein n=1 Tax=Heterodera schachtii TaxID=97005 RepID=A0ABD2JPD4_HETSC